MGVFNKKEKKECGSLKDFLVSILNLSTLITLHLLLKCWLSELKAN